MFGAFGEDGGHLLHWHVVRMNYGITDFMMLNTVNLSGFVTLTLGHFVTPQQVRHWFVVNRERNVFESLSLCHAYSKAQLRAVVSM